MSIQLTRGVVFTETDEQAVLTGAGRKAAYYRLNEVGAILLRGLLAGRTEETVTQDVAREYDVDVELVRQDLVNLLASLVDARLIEKP